MGNEAICKWCGSTNDVRRRRQNTAYVEAEQNYITCCAECFERVEEEWRERWDEYYANCM